MKVRTKHAALFCGLTLPIVSAGAAAQMLEEVVVTAQKRAEGLQDVPISIAVLGGDVIEGIGMVSMEELTPYLPSVHVGQSGGQNQIIFIGQGAGSIG